MNRSLDDLVPENICKLRPYQPGKPIEELERELGIQGAIKLASNENPMGASRLAVDAAKEALDGVHFYPDGGVFRLRHRLAEELDLKPEQLVFGGGSNDLIGLIMDAFCTGGRDAVLAPKHAFISYRLSALARDLDFVEADVDECLGCDVDAMIAKISANTRVIFLANPNNPTGSYLPRKEFERLLSAVPTTTVFVMDEAYHEYARVYADDYPQCQQYMGAERPLLINLRTFSKIHGLAGLRVGYGVCDARVANYIDRVRRPFNVTSVGQAAATAALDDREHVERSVAVTRASTEAIRRTAEAAGARAYPTIANFVLIDVGVEADSVYQKLMQSGVIVRPMAAWGLPTCLRISAASEDDTKRACRALEEAL